MTLLTKDQTLSNWLKGGEVDGGVSRVEKTIANASGGTWTIPIGFPLIDNVPAVAATIGTADGFTLEKVVIANGASATVAVLATGPAKVLPPTAMNDLAAAAFNMATYATRLLAIGATVLSPPNETEEQTT